MQNTALRIATFFLFAITAGILIAAPPAHCEWCIATFCGTSAECPGQCVCAIPQGGATGHCMGIR